MKMKLALSKKNIKMLSADSQKLPTQATPAVAGGGFKTYRCTFDCLTETPFCRTYNPTNQTGCCNSTIC
ncbi:hypothetical protein [Pseudoalteromonas sp. McH1-42]|uniref:hypothetical protein n=1 Tax=Pseudoalteromonas sp. McH1-42 TaxID=2917752 RepID=UPI001EF647CA|nr:hypothetical protein [Pseudoalteromonas sp. McH1-42]MCG7560802.1 hypothetical protein [Pseudoalteromonas sp. McH1-42]